jgi:uncharacterized repeat protein (TIGR03803 family)
MIRVVSIRLTPVSHRDPNLILDLILDVLTCAVFEATRFSIYTLVFPRKSSGIEWTLKTPEHGVSVAHSFQGPPDAAFAYNGMVADAAGNFYGATVHGGVDGEGAIYKFTPNQKSRDDEVMLLGTQANKK